MRCALTPRSERPSRLLERGAMRLPAGPSALIRTTMSSWKPNHLAVSTASSRPSAGARGHDGGERKRDRRRGDVEAVTEHADRHVGFDAEVTMQRAGDTDGQGARAGQQESEARETMADRVGRANEQHAVSAVMRW